MIDIKQDKEKDKTAEPAQADAQRPVAPKVDMVTSRQELHELKSPAKAEPQKKPEMSIGEKQYNRRVYFWMNYALNLVGSLAIADYVRNLGGRKYLDQGINAISKGLSATKLLTHKTAKNTAAIVLGTLALNSGGWVLLVPSTWIENRKRKIVHALNEKAGVEQIAPDGHKETPEEIYIEQEQPKQSPMNAFKRRLMASGATIATGLVLNKVLAKKLPNPMMVDGHLSEVLGGEKRITDFVVNQSNRALTSGYVPGGDWLAKNKRVQAYLGFGALDWVYTIITAKIMHLTNGAKKARLPHEIGDEVDPAGSDATPDVITFDKAPAAEKPIEKPESHAEKVTRNDATRYKEPDFKQLLKKPQFTGMRDKVAASLASEQGASPLHSV